MARHSLKTWPQFYEAVRTGAKTFEVRKDDRNFQINDILELNEWDPTTKQSTGRTLFRRVSYITSKNPCVPIEEGYVILAITPLVADTTNNHLKRDDD